MRLFAKAQFATAFLLLSVALAHSHDELGNAGIMPHDGALFQHGSNMTDITVPQSYFRHEPSSSWIYAHIVLMTFAWAIMLPVAVVLSIAQSSATISMQLAFVCMNVVGVLAGAVYNGKVPDLYPKNVHHRLGWAIIFVALGQVMLGLLKLVASQKQNDVSNNEERECFIPITVQALAEHQQSDFREKIRRSRYSHDSGQGTEQASSAFQSPAASPWNEERQPSFSRSLSLDGVEREDNSVSSRASKDKQVLFRRLRSLLSKRVLFLPKKVQKLADTCYEILNRSILLLGFVALTTGIVTFSGIFQARHIFNGLAHFIKGAIFLWYGILVLGRYAGAFSDLGWAWNVKPTAEVVGKRKAAIPTAEFVESFLIFFYGSTNVFLEHLDAWGKKWSAQDLEHVSISIMFFGGGLCGMLVESRKIRNSLSSVLDNLKQSQSAQTTSKQAWRQPPTYSVSLNPFPALIILLLGLMMGSHHQASAVSTMIHKQWGMLFVGAAFARAVTYILLYIAPPSSIYPSRPPSELIVSFCLISGGIIFMASNKDTVRAMEANGLDAMFIFTITMGFSAFLMAWTLLVMAIKGWAGRRNVNVHPRLYSGV